MKMTIKAALKDIDKQIKKDAKAYGKAVKATISDVRRMLPGKAADEIINIYNLKKTEVMPMTNKKKPVRGARRTGQVSATGTRLESANIIYRGRMLTPLRFGMKPKKPPTRPESPNARVKKKARKPKPITAEVKRGRRRSLGDNVFLTKPRKYPDSPYLPFYRKGKNPYPLVMRKAVSVPQMVRNEKVKPEVDKHVNNILDKRLKHNVRRFVK